MGSTPSWYARARTSHTVRTLCIAGRISTGMPPRFLGLSVGGWAAAEVESSYGYIPFHGGPRICPGRKFVLALSLYCGTDMRNRRLCTYRDAVYDCANA
jgi:hypothetical protein